MNQAFEYFRQAELSLAAYAVLSMGEPNQDKLKEAGMSPLQAATFAANWTTKGVSFEFFFENQSCHAAHALN